jgi:serine/threonine-protein kinase RsbW
LKTVIERQYKSRRNAVVKAEKLTEKITRRLEFDENERMDIAIAVTEAVNNALEHGNQLTADKLVTLRFEVTSTYLRIVVRDQGDGFSLAGVADPLAPENLTKPNGRGLLIVDSLMDEVEVKPTPRGTEVVMVKRLN